MNLDKALEATRHEGRSKGAEVTGQCLTSSDTCSEGVMTTGNWLEMRWSSGNFPLFLKSLGLRPSSDSLAVLCKHSYTLNKVQHRRQ